MHAVNQWGCEEMVEEGIAYAAGNLSEEVNVIYGRGTIHV